MSDAFKRKENAELAAALEEIAALERAAKKRQVQAEGGEDMKAALEESALQAALDLSAEEAEKQQLATVLAASDALQKQRNAKRRQLQVEGGHDEGLMAALEESAAFEERRRRAASAKRRSRQAEGGHDEGLMAALEESAASEEQRKRAASAEGRRREHFGVWTEENIAALPPLEAVVHRPGNIRSSRRNRRRSVAKAKNPLARHTMAPMQTSCLSDGVTASKLNRFSTELLSCIGNDGGPEYTCYEYLTAVREDVHFPTTIAGSRRSYGYASMTCTAMIILFGFGSDYGHFVPYVRIRKEWFIADNEKGGLVRRTNGMPNGRTKYYNVDGTLSGTIDRVFLFYAEDSLIQPGRLKVDTGLPLFGQTKDTCGPDGLQSILMFADGFHEYFYAGLYRKLVPQFNPLFWGGSHERVTDKQVNDELSTLKGSLLSLMVSKDESRGGAEGRSHDGAKCNDAIIEFLLSMFLRLYRIENIPEEELQGINWGLNTTDGDWVFDEE